MKTDNKIEELSGFFGKKLKSQKIYNPNIQDSSEKTLVIDRQIRLREFSKYISVEIASNTTIAVSINIPDKICLINNPLKIKGFPYRLFYDNEFADNPNSFLIDNIGLFEDLKLSDNESMIIYKNQICIFANKNRNFIELIDKLKMICKSLPTPDSNAFDIKGLPDSLKILVPLTEKWSISDDELRSELIETFSSDDKKNIIDKVKPLIAEINDYLDDFKENPLTEIAQKICNLTEIYEEIKTAYNKRYV
jgi:hypothetical protein